MFRVLFTALAVSLAALAHAESTSYSALDLVDAQAIDFPAQNCTN